MAAAATSREGRGTYINFSRPQRSESVSSMKFPRKSTSTTTIQEDVEETLPYRPAKAKFVQLHVTSDDIGVARPLSTGELKKPVIPDRHSSLHRKTNTWPSTIREQRAGSLKFDSVPTLVRTPWEIERNRPGSRWSRSSDRSKNAPRRVFGQLPREIYQCIVDHLERVHSTESTVDVTGLRKDLRSLCQVDKKWHRIAREHLYKDLWLPNSRTPAKRKWSRHQPRSRLRQLIDTLQGAPGLAFLVHRIHFTAELADELQYLAYLPFRKDSAVDLLQQLIRQCYNLEQLCGYALPATESARPVLHALSTRTRMKSYAWNLNSETGALPNLADFIYSHVDWLQLDTLIVSGDDGVDLGQIAMSAVLPRLPSLKHVMISGLHSEDFNNNTLLSLPALKSLRLENLAGVTDQGVEQLAFSRLAPSLEQLRLVGLELVSLQTFETLFSHLTRLKRFALVQESSPEAQSMVKAKIGMSNFASYSLISLHWDCLVPGEALNLFAKAVEDNRFPALRRVKVPCDYDGVIQDMCRPLPRSKLMQDDLDYLEQHTELKYERNLRVAQIQAQLRIRESRQQPSFNVVVQDESLEIQQTHVIGSYLGTMGSRIEYSLEPEAGSNALAEFEDVARPQRMQSPRLEQRVGFDVLF